MSRMTRFVLQLLSTACVGLWAQMAAAETLQDIYALALQNDYQHKANKAALKAGKQAKVIGLANLLPRISASASYSDSTEQDVGQVFVDQPPSTFDVESETETYLVTLKQPVIDMVAWFGYQQGATLSEQAEAQYNADQQKLIIRTTRAYFDVLRRADFLKTYRVEEAAIAKQLDETQQRYDVGLGTITGVHEAQAAFDDANATSIQAQADLSVTFEALSAFVGKRIAAVSPLNTRFPVVAPVPAARHDWVESALQNNPDLQVAKLSATVARQKSRASTSAHLPTVSASFSYAERSDTNTDLMFPDSTINEDLRINEQGVATITIDVPIFSGRRASGERRRDIALQMQAQDLHLQAQRDIAEDVRSLHIDVTVGVETVSTRKQAIASNQRALDATQSGYKAGTRNLVDVLVAQRSLSQARRNYYDALYDYILQMLQLKEVAGTLSPEDIVQLDSWLASGQAVARSKIIGDIAD